MAAASFELFGSSHLASLICLVFWICLQLYVAHLLKAREVPVSGRALTLRFLEASNLALVVVAILMQHSARWWAGHWDLRWDLPLQLCDWAFLSLALAFLTRHRFLYEISYFWGLAGTLQGMLTPHLGRDFPSIEFLAFFLFHGGVIAAALFNAIAQEQYPRGGAFWKVALASQVYLLTALLANFLIQGANYGFLMEKPDASLMDYMGPWPWYILSLELAGLFSFWLYDLPWRWFRNRNERRYSQESPPP
ncbi:MAG: TIGR02206 family membrane protein [Spirochaetales bacterium]|nr:TIGR02206 family membrane protein [Spirochaetales bacterium]